MLTRRAKAYSSSCSQIASLSPAISSQFILGMCAAAEDRKINKKTFILELQGLLKSSMLIRLKSSSLVLVVIGSTPMPICNRFHERLTNNGKITTLWRYGFLMPPCPGFLEPKKNRDLNRRNLRLMLKILYVAFPCLSKLISAQVVLKMCLTA